MLGRRFHVHICGSTMMLFTTVLLLISTACGVSCLSAHAPANLRAAPNKSDSDMVLLPPAAVFGNGQERAIGSAAATFLARQAGASLARLFGSTDVAGGESEGLIPRTFGRIQKKIYAGLLPVMFKMGIMTMVIVTILLLVAKSVLIGKLLLIINLGFVLAKLIAWKQHDGDGHHGGGGGGGWSKSNAAGQNDIHLHIHNAAPAIYPVATHQQHDLPYGAHLQQRGPSIHIDPAPAPSSGYGGGYDSWGAGGYSQRRQQTGNEYAYVETAATSGYQPTQSNPMYIPNTRFKR